ncbi:unnamed protein product [Alopecurus aequalis]
MTTAMASKMVATLFLILLLTLTPSDGQVLPTPCCRFDCCDGKPECCGPWRPPAAFTAAAPATFQAAAPSTFQAAATARKAGSAMAGAAPRKVLTGN